MLADQTAGSGRVKISQFLGKVPESVVLWKEAARVHSECNVRAARSPIFAIFSTWITLDNIMQLFHGTENESFVSGVFRDAEHESGTDTRKGVWGQIC